VVSGQPDAGGVSPATRDNQSKLWDHPDGPSVEARHRSRLYNASTLLTLTSGVLICYVALYLVNVAWALFILDPHVMGSYLQTRLGYADLFVLAWLVASAATFGGALATGLESDEAIRTAAYSKREEERRERLARQRRAAERWPGAGGHAAWPIGDLVLVRPGGGPVHGPQAARYRPSTPRGRPRRAVGDTPLWPR
jgi:hypothetical protein